MKKTLLQERFQQLAGIKPLSVSKIDELDLGQRASGFFGKAKAFLNNLTGKSDAGKDVARDLKQVGLGTGFTAYISSEGKDMVPDLEEKYIIDKFRPARQQTLNQKVRYTQHQATSWKPGSPFIAIQANFDLKQEEPKLKGKVFALNFLTGKYDYIKDFEEKGKTGIPDKSSDEAIAAFQGDVDRMTQSPITITVRELMKMLKLEVSADETPAGATQPTPAIAESKKIKKSELRKLIKETIKNSFKKK